MRHRLADIARNNRFNEEQFVRYAHKRDVADFYGVEVHPTTPKFSTVSTWYTDDIIRAFKKFLEEI